MCKSHVVRGRSLPSLSGEGGTAREGQELRDACAKAKTAHSKQGTRFLED